MNFCLGVRGSLREGPSCCMSSRQPKSTVSPLRHAKSLLHLIVLVGEFSHKPGVKFTDFTEIRKEQNPL